MDDCHLSYTPKFLKKNIHWCGPLICGKKEVYANERARCQSSSMLMSRSLCCRQLESDPTETEERGKSGSWVHRGQFVISYLSVVEFWDRIHDLISFCWILFVEIIFSFSVQQSVVGLWNICAPILEFPLVVPFLRWSRQALRILLLGPWFYLGFFLFFLPPPFSPSILWAVVVLDVKVLLRLPSRWPSSIPPP